MLALVLNGLRPCQGALTTLLGSFNLLGQLGLLLLEKSKHLLHLAPEVRLSLEFIMSAPNTLFGHKNLLGDMYETTRGLHKEYILKELKCRWNGTHHCEVPL